MALEDRIHTAMARGRDEAGMHMHENWPARFAEAGFAVESERRLVIALQPPPNSMPWPPALSARDDLTVRTTRTVWLARKPAG